MWKLVRKCKVNTSFKWCYHLFSQTLMRCCSAVLIGSLFNKGTVQRVLQGPLRKRLPDESLTRSLLTRPPTGTHTLQANDLWQGRYREQEQERERARAREREMCAAILNFPPCENSLLYQINPTKLVLLFHASSPSSLIYTCMTCSCVCAPKTWKHLKHS